MRIIVMYDVSFETNEDVKKYNNFRKELLKLGYVMMQYSIYVKNIGTHTLYKSEKTKIQKVLPKKSNVRIMMITEKEYQDIEILNGEKSLSEIYNNFERYIKI
ncbi:CRISPR-associated endonuclease Cas2 [Mycoplasmopsis lipofaciens]|uniref:CRISPR-associated endonuclease Cas2 n=1 Tax=Mycoplasmopsis lipofaciens TaxID=114884 RepID=UPI0005684227|nr:CRISPR-associated endonuclease Cas2 [Mycoplasmopsis lipofaciens]